MVEIKPVEPVKLFCGIITVNEQVAIKAKNGLSRMFGEIDLESDFFPFDFTDYYGDEMGEKLLRKFVSFSETIEPSRLADIKLQTNNLEQKFAVERDGRLCRTVNLDPGYVTAGKVVLATAKNFAHRIYLRNGIYAEVTMNFKKNACVYHNWTYPDFKSGRYTTFFLKLRTLIMEAYGNL